MTNSKRKEIETKAILDSIDHESDKNEY